MIWKLLNIISSLSNKSENVKGSETEVTRDFVFRREASLWEPPQATIGLQRSFCRTLKAIMYYAVRILWK